MLINAMMTVIEGYYHRIARQIYGNDSEEGQRQRMIVGIGGRGIVYNGALKNKVVREEAESKNHIVFIRETDIKNL